MSAQSEGKALHSSDDPERKIEGVDKKDPLVLRKSEVHGDFDECVHRNDGKATSRSQTRPKSIRKVSSSPINPGA